MSATLAPRLGHLDRIDVLRAVAILLVFFCHALPFMSGGFDLKWNESWVKPVSGLGMSAWWLYPLYLGWSGVSLFFVISGFCIHCSFLKQERAAPGGIALGKFVREFFWRRFWRIYPPYLLALVVFSWLEARHGNAPSASNFWLHVFLGHNFSSATHMAIAAVFWSLAVEWQFYLLYPAVLWLRRRWGMRGAFAAVLGLSLVVRLVAALVQDWNQPENQALWSSPLILLFDWMLGAVLAEKWAAGLRWPGLTRSAPWLGVAFVAATLWQPARVFSFTLASLMFAGLMEACLHCTAPLARWERWLVPVGVWSYSFYLWHHPLIGRILHYLDRLGLPQTSVVLFVVVPTLVLGLILLWSWAAYSLVEKPCLRAGHALLVRWRSSGPTTGK